MISERLPHVRSATIGYWIGAGSRDETEARAGISHFIEHLLFKGSSRYSALEIAEIFDELGGELNAATSREHTVVFARVPDSHVETALDVMGDMVFSPLFDDLDSEREVVLEEIAMYEDTPQELVHDLIGEAVFGSHALGPPGDRHRGGDLERQPPLAARLPPLLLQPRRTSSSRRPGASTTTSSSRSSSARSTGAARRTATGRASARRSSRPRSPAAASSARTPSSTTSASAATGVSRSDRRRFAASILDAILGGSASSRLFQEIREKRGMAYSVYSFLSQYADTGQIGIYVGTREDNLGEALAIAVRAGRRHRRRQPAARGAQARPGEPQGPPAALDGVDLGADDAAREVARHRHRDPLARPAGRRDRRGRRRGRLRARRRAARTRSGSRRPGSARARSTSSRRSSARLRRSPRAA